MKIGFIGAGKVGFSMGKYLTGRGIEVTGYYSRNPESSLEAANFTDTKQFLDLEQLVGDSDAIFLTVPDGEIASVWEQLKELPIQGKIISHFSGAQSSDIFSERGRIPAYGYSIHPLFAFNDKYSSYKDADRAFYAIEGDSEKMADIRRLLEIMGSGYTVISAQNKIRYHAAASIVSNLYVGLTSMAEQILTECGFAPDDAHRAFSPLIMNNARNIVSYGTEGALTGPVERSDIATVEGHIANLSQKQSEVYKMLSAEVLEVAKRKHPDRDYQEMEKIL
ncbi:MAG: F420-dependent NADP oxidoreductase [Eubacteriaceae bacterium]|jgi:predicted short-subunit dehydrogenase-like oxidoreductase (DUF2520 family)|nr:F420-dependent NADP oxidoreductase [Eubacteriaceae bacterium]